MYFSEYLGESCGMCASYMIKQRNPKLYGFLNEMRSDDFEQFADKLIVPRTAAPVVRLDRKTFALSALQFSLLPSWSKEPKVKFATHNARIESITEKPTWRDAFAKRHCLVPLTHFVEPIYEGEHAGHMVGFHHPGDEILMAAGIWESWANKQTGEVIESFAIITTEPPASVARIGHDRCPVFLTSVGQREWLEDLKPPEASVKFLLSNQVNENFAVERQREMRPGWEKRK